MSVLELTLYACDLKIIKNGNFRHRTPSIADIVATLQLSYSVRAIQKKVFACVAP